MLTGTLPFTVEDGNILRLLHLHTHRAPPPLGPAVPPGLRRLVERCLSKEPKERPEIQELGRILTGDFGTGDLLTG
jgi:serine/threonine protein kinase